MSFCIEDHLKLPPPWVYLMAYVIPGALLIAIASFWPEHSSPLGLDFTQSALARNVPSIAAYIKKSEFPHTTAAYFALTGFLAFPYLIFSIKYPNLLFFKAKTVRLGYQIYKEKRVKTWIFLVSFCILGFWISWVQPGYQMGIFSVNSSRSALALSGIWHSFYFSISVCTVMLRSYIYFEKIFRLERKHHGME